jgi:hypothetical protein
MNVIQPYLKFLSSFALVNFTIVAQRCLEEELPRRTPWTSCRMRCGVEARGLYHKVYQSVDFWRRPVAGPKPPLPPVIPLNLLRKILGVGAHPSTWCATTTLMNVVSPQAERTGFGSGHRLPY